MPSINFIICLGDDTLCVAALGEECEDREADDNDTLKERAGEPNRDDELDLCEAAEAATELEFLGLGGIKGICGVNTGEADDED